MGEGEWEVKAVRRKLVNIRNRRAYSREARVPKTHVIVVVTKADVASPHGTEGSNIREASG